MWIMLPRIFCLSFYQKRTLYWQVGTTFQLKHGLQVEIRKLQLFFSIKSIFFISHLVYKQPLDGNLLSNFQGSVFFAKQQ